MNLERLKQLRDFLQNHPDSFDYRTYAGRHMGNEYHPDSFDIAGKGVLKILQSSLDNQHDCGTVGCIAGWAVALFGDEQELCENFISEYAASLLELPISVARSLFSSDNWRPGDNGLGIAIHKLTKLIEQQETEGVLRAILSTLKTPW